MLARAAALCVALALGACEGGERTYQGALLDSPSGAVFYAAGNAKPYAVETNDTLIATTGARAEASAGYCVTGTGEVKNGRLTLTSVESAGPYEAACAPAGAKLYAGALYVAQNRSVFYTAEQTAEEERGWWLDAATPAVTAALERAQEDEPVKLGLDHFYCVDVLGVTSPPGEYGYRGGYARQIFALEIASARALWPPQPRISDPPLTRCKAPKPASPPSSGN